MITKDDQIPEYAKLLMELVQDSIKYKGTSAERCIYEAMHKIIWEQLTFVEIREHR